MGMLRALSRLPLGLWLRGLLGAALVIALIGFGVALLAAFLVAVVVGVLIYKARDMIAGWFGHGGGPSMTPAPAKVARRARVSDADYTVVER
ncbi:MAG: hypothetical protein IPK81_21280 [Rhodospirillales bacterium]|nr:hypothetical protein [Rhodospirillales bacterium]QQS12026.1 MAG: hypothetical protein IPK81_21280 [Rhodospirillales bacterium]